MTYPRLIALSALLALVTVLPSSVEAAKSAQLDLDNLSPYTNPCAAWSDRNSTVTLSWNQPDQPGLQTMIDLFGAAGSKLTDNLLMWSIAENGEELPLKFKSRNYRPDKVIETDTAGDIQLTVTASYPARNCLGLEFELANPSDSPRTVRMGFAYPGKGKEPTWKGQLAAMEFVSIDGEPDGSWSVLDYFIEHGRNVLWVQGYVAGMLNATTVEMACLSDMRSRNITLPPRGKAGFTTYMAFGRKRIAAEKARDEFLAKEAKGWTSGEETKRWQGFFAKLHPIAPKYRGNTKYERMYAHSAAQLTSLFVRGDGGYLGDKCVSLSSKYGLAMAFFWDNAFSCVGQREVDAQLAQQAVQCFTDNPSPRGSLPGTLLDANRSGEGQAPILTWAAWAVYQKTHDKSWLAKVYPGLAGYNRFWFKYHSSPRGLCQYFNAGQIADDDARFDPIQAGNANQNLTGFESPDLNAYLVMDLKCLANMAEVLGLKSEAANWKRHADELAQKIIDTMYFPEDAMFFDVATGTRDKFSGVKGPNMFLPLWAGVPLPKEEVKKIVEKHMLNPDEFYREYPFPSLSCDDPKYNPAGYWRGRIWPHVVYWMVQTLWRQGYHAEAEQTADRMLKMLAQSPHIHENYESKNGGVIGLPDYNWSLATAIELLLERYKEPMP